MDNDEKVNEDKNSRLKKENLHQRDSNISFYSENHKYIVSQEVSSNKSDPNTIVTKFDHGYTSVTTHLEDHFETFDDDLAITKMMAGRNWREGHKWWGWTRENLKTEWERIKDHASKQGESLHAKIELFMNNDKLSYPYTFGDLLADTLSKDNDVTIETENLKVAWRYFLNFAKEHSYLQPYRTEWRIYDEESKIAGSIDLLCKIPFTTCYQIIDWKMSKKITVEDEKYPRYCKTDELKHLPDTNFYHYALQQNMYRIILKKHYGIEVSTMYLVQLHPELENYQLIEVPDLSKEVNLILGTRAKQFSKG
jgi:hypothetical protein